VKGSSKKRAFSEGEPYHAHHESTTYPYCIAHRWETLTANGGHGQPQAQAERVGQ